MWWPDPQGRAALAAAIVAVIAAGGLAGCGFRPVHGTDSAASVAHLAEIRVLPIADRVGQQLHNLLLDKLNPLGPPAVPRYVLQVELTENLQNLAVRKDEVATRANLVMRATFSLTQSGAEQPAFSGTAISANSYNNLRSDFATLSAESDARARAVREISEEIRARVGIFLARSQ